MREVWLVLFVMYALAGVVAYSSVSHVGGALCMMLAVHAGLRARRRRNLRGRR